MSTVPRGRRSHLRCARPRDLGVPGVRGGCSPILLRSSRASRQPALCVRATPVLRQRCMKAPTGSSALAPRRDVVPGIRNNAICMWCVCVRAHAAGIRGALGVLARVERGGVGLPASAAVLDRVVRGGAHRVAHRVDRYGRRSYLWRRRTAHRRGCVNACGCAQRRRDPEAGSNTWERSALGRLKTARLIGMLERRLFRARNYITQSATG
jgi:hypothetical protein